jgi:hypothetical protein
MGIVVDIIGNDMNIFEMSHATKKRLHLNPGLSREELAKHDLERIHEKFVAQRREREAKESKKLTPDQRQFQERLQVQRDHKATLRELERIRGLREKKEQYRRWY